MTVLETTDLTKSFGGLTAVDHLDLTVEENEIVGLIGPNGSGKTTTFNLVTGFYSIDGGTVRLTGSDITSFGTAKRASHGIVRTFQRPKPFGTMTVRENMMVANTPDLSRVEKESRAERILDDIELDHEADSRGKDLSGGQKKLLEIGRALMLDPEIILLDEPAAGVNPALMDDIMDYIRDLHDDGHTFLLIEHDMSIIADLCDRVVVMHNGQKIADGPFEEVRDNEQVRSAYLGGQ
ncbi:ABC transporter ATP-binding protein [Natrinema halophilum]|uniref:ABC transporter ATP-binding protein n=1 Tax=Natrinema halophilum TaxID=1699371 RepID=A0A7D5KCB9_9EURY|nr:ABC transporter ATP-binding protein [Natrinema halophilum]QLG48496.1 ABC transporter ATP-binding protein [Natrinema halophilum]